MTSGEFLVCTIQSREKLSKFEENKKELKSLKG